MVYHMTATVEMDVSEFLSDDDRREGVYGYEYVDRCIESFNTGFDAQITGYDANAQQYGVFDMEVVIEYVGDDITFEEWESYEYEFLSYLGENWSNVEVWEDEE